MSLRHWRRLAVAGMGGAGLLCVALIFAPFFYEVGRLGLARWRWAQHGNAAYRVVVTQFCNCYQMGKFELTVAGGQVVAVRRTDDIAQRILSPLDPAYFNSLTVEAAFEQAGQNIREHWLPERYRRYRVEYDPELGYVRLLETGDPNVPYFFYIYAAADVRPASP